MNENIISLPVFETMKLAWQKVKGSKSTFFAIFLCILAIKIITVVLGVGTHFTVVKILLLTVEFFLVAGATYIGVQRAMDSPIQFSMIKRVLNAGIFFRSIGFSILFYIILFLPFTLSYLPGLFVNSPTTNNVIKLFSALLYLTGFVAFFFAIYFLFRLSLTETLIIVKRASLWTSLKTSFKATKSNVWNLMALIFSGFIIIILSVIPLGIGLIWSFPYFAILMGEIYKKLVVSRQDLNEIL